MQGTNQCSHHAGHSVGVPTQGNRLLHGTEGARPQAVTQEAPQGAGDCVHCCDLKVKAGAGATHARCAQHPTEDAEVVLGAQGVPHAQLPGQSTQ